MFLGRGTLFSVDEKSEREESVRGNDGWLSYSVRLCGALRSFSGRIKRGFLVAGVNWIKACCTVVPSRFAAGGKVWLMFCTRL